MVVMYNDVAAVENIVGDPQKIKHCITIWSRNSTAKKESKSSVHWWITEKQKVVYTHNGILFILKKEENFDTCYHTDEVEDNMPD